LKARGYDLRAVPVFRFQRVIEDPAKRYGVQIDEELVAALINDAPEEDALPLLAFALQRLWHRYAATGAISRDNYQSVGGLKLLIEDAAERALRGLGPGNDVPSPAGSLPQQRAELAATTFVPALAQFNDQGAIIRHAAPWSGFSDEQQQLLVNFDLWRLIIRKGTDAAGGTVEVAHEALFREWTRLKNWLEPERARLEALRSLQLDALTWNRNRRDPAFLHHRSKRLAEANALVGIESYRRRLGEVDSEYLAACQLAERRARRGRRRIQVLVGVMGVGLIALIAAWWNHDWLRERVYAIENVRALSVAREHSLKPEESFRECADCPVMIVVPAGDFQMGSPAHGKKQSIEDQRESPQHEVVIAKSFAVGRYAVTFEEWDACAAHGDCDTHINDSGWGRGRHPVIDVNWNNARSYVAWLSRITGKPYRLLSEAEYEYAARAGTTTAYSFGDDWAMLGEYAWFLDNSDHQAHPVGEKKRNAFGLFDMHGNVEQWVEDCWHESYYGAPSDGSAWTSADCPLRVVRGGSWLDNSYGVRSASRYGGSADYRKDTRGFRVARTLDVH
jgi:formylglycine-generating enzyme required for sulfatase activity